MNTRTARFAATLLIGVLSTSSFGCRGSADPFVDAIASSNASVPTATAQPTLEPVTPDPTVGPPVFADPSGVDDVAVGAYGFSNRNVPLLADVGPITVDGVTIDVGSVVYREEIEYQDGRDRHERFIEVSLAFDAAHDFEEWDFSLTTHTGLTLLADAGQVVPQESGTLRFSVDDEVRNTSGWTLTVAANDDAAQVDL